MLRGCVLQRKILRLSRPSVFDVLAEIFRDLVDRGDASCDRFVVFVWTEGFSKVVIGDEYLSGIFGMNASAKRQWTSLSSSQSNNWITLSRGQCVKGHVVEDDAIVDCRIELFKCVDRTD